jgi:hypothetical protein
LFLDAGTEVLLSSSCVVTHDLGNCATYKVSHVGTSSSAGLNTEKGNSRSIGKELKEIETVMKSDRE